MISIQRTSGSGLSKLIIGLLLLVAAVGMWFFMQSDDVPPGVAPVDGGAQTSAIGGAPSAESSAGYALPHPDEPATDTAALSAAMGTQPDGEKQLNRVLVYLKFQREFERWQGMQGEAPDADLSALGTRLLNELPEHVANRSMTQPEGDFMCGMVLSAIEPNPAMLETRIAACQAAVKATAPPLDTQAAMNRVDCESDYRAREAALVSAFQSLPSARRDPAKLQADLDAAHTAVYREARCQ